jgi:F-type H+-transporting ATPase subunit gamma
LENTRDIKQRIKSVTNIQQITKAMKMVAAARLRKAEARAKGSRPYAEKIAELLQNASAAAPGFSSPLLAKREVKKTGYLVITADRGLAGAYNSNVMKRLIRTIGEKDPKDYALFVCGKQAREYLGFRGYKLTTFHSGFSDKPSADDAKEVAQEAVKFFLDEKVDEVRIIYTKFITALRQEVQEQLLLPVSNQAGGTDQKAENKDGYIEYPVPFIFLPNASQVLEKLLPEYVKVQVYNAMLQSAASELGSRMAAMTAATDNATDRINELNLSYNKARQAQVTNEISEIVGGANALE